LHKEKEMRATADEKRIGQLEKGFVGLDNFIDETPKSAARIWKPLKN
jgi:hypothetical protein